MNWNTDKPPSLDQAVEWRTPIWGPAVGSLLERAGPGLRPGARLLEPGFGSGLMACHLAANYGLRVTGLETDPGSLELAESNAERFGLEELLEFRLADSSQGLDIPADFDIVFFKSFLYHLKTPHEYGDWLDFFVSRLRPGGVLLAAENGRGGALDKFFRKRIRRSRWSEFMLFDRTALSLFEKRFARTSLECFGRFSQFLSFSPGLCAWARTLENRLCPPGPDHCFVAAIVAEKKA